MARKRQEPEEAEPAVTVGAAPGVAEAEIEQAPAYVITAADAAGMAELLAVWRYWQIADPARAREMEPVVRQFELYTKPED
jgi:hypothetical protein